jgi:hypothetical protein
MKLIRELVEDVEYITEDKNGEKQHYIQGPFIQTNVLNRNKRFYEMKIVEPEVNRYVTEVLKDGRAYGELGHPPGPQINLERVSHIITELHRDGDNFMGKARLADTPMGNIAKGLLACGAKLGVSSRGMGSLVESKDGTKMVQGDFRLVTAGDIVADPSAPSAYVTSVMENVEWVYDGTTGEWQRAVEETKRQVRSMTMEQLEKRKLSLFESFIDSLSKS